MQGARPAHLNTCELVYTLYNMRNTTILEQKTFSTNATAVFRPLVSSGRNKGVQRSSAMRGRFTNDPTCKLISYVLDNYIYTVYYTVVSFGFIVQSELLFIFEIFIFTLPSLSSVFVARYCRYGFS